MSLFRCLETNGYKPVLDLYLSWHGHRVQELPQLVLASFSRMCRIPLESVGEWGCGKGLFQQLPALVATSHAW